MIARLRRMRDIACLVRDLPEILALQLVAESEALSARIAFGERLRQVEDDLKDIEQQVADLDAMTREFYGVRPIGEEVRRDA